MFCVVINYGFGVKPDHMFKPARELSLRSPWLGGRRGPIWR